MNIDREFIELASVIVALASYIVRLEYRASRSASDIKGLSIREAANTKHEQRMFILRIASDLEAAAWGNREVKRLAEILREAVK